MKKIFFLSFCVVFSNCRTQTKINKSEDVDILFRNGSFIIGSNKVVRFNLKNNTEKTFVIDPYGFYGKTIEMEDKQVMRPTFYLTSGNYQRKNSSECSNDLIILKPHKSIEAVLKLDSNNRSVYSYSPNREYHELIKSIHNRSNVSILGCEAFIDNLEKMGYEVLEDSISIKIPLYFSDKKNRHLQK